jgi:hypothetical protein
MSTTIQNTINFSQPFIQYSPLSVGTDSQPAVGVANEIQYMIMSAPFTWTWNRKEDSSLVTQIGVQDYLVNLTDFAYLEEVTLTDAKGVTFAVQDVYNTKVLGPADSNINKQSRPNAACIFSTIFGTSLKIRFMGVPDAAYTVTLTYQKLVTPMTALTGVTGTWTIPDQYQDIYNNLFLAEAMASVDDARSVSYRQRGVATLLAKAEGLNEMQKNAFLMQFWSRYGEHEIVNSLRAQQSIQARSA